MSRLLFFYLGCSLSASFLMILLFLGKPLWKNRLSKTWQYYIWLLVIVRLLIPFSPTPGMIGQTLGAIGQRQARDFDQQQIGDSPEQNPGQNPGWDAGQYAEKPSTAQPSTVQPSEGIPSEPPSVQQPPAEEMSAIRLLLVRLSAAGKTAALHLYPYLWLLWLLPAAAMLLYQLISYYGYVRRLRKASLPVTDPEVLMTCRQVEAALKQRQITGLYYCKAVVSPMLIGIWKPCILLPTEEFSSHQLSYIFLHELTHWKRKDILYKWLLQTAVCLHWFHPLVYLMRRECDRACELACDEAVARGLEPEQRKAYGDTLIVSLRAGQGHARFAGSLSMCENARTLKERLGAIMQIKKSSKIQKAAAIFCTLAAAGSLLFLGGFSAEAGENKMPRESETVRQEETMYQTSGEDVIKQESTKKGMTDPWLNDSENPESKKWRHSFSTKSFLVDKFGIRLAWNNDPSLYDVTRTIYLDEETTIQVSFIKEMEGYAGDARVLEAIRLAILEQQAREKKEEGKDSIWKSLIMTNPVVVEVVGPYEESYDQLTVMFYEEGRIQYFASAAEKATEETRLNMLKRIYEDRNIAYFSSIAGSISEEARLEYMQKAYEEKEISFFSVLSNEASDETLGEFAKKSYESEEIAFFSVCTKEMSDEDKKAYAYRAYEEDKISFFSITVDSLNEQEQNALAERAKREGKEIYMYVMPEYNN